MTTPLWCREKVMVYYYYYYYYFVFCQLNFIVLFLFLIKDYHITFIIIIVF